VKLRRLSLKGFKDCIIEIADKKNTTIDDLLQKAARSDIMKSKSLKEVNLFNISYGVLSFYKEPYTNRFQSYDNDGGDNDNEETYNDLNNNKSSFIITEKRRASTGFGTTSRDLLPGFIPLSQDINSPSQLHKIQTLCLSPNDNNSSSNKKITPNSALRRASISVNNSKNNNDSNDNTFNKNKNLRRRSMALIEGGGECTNITVGSDHVRSFLHSCFNYYSTHQIDIGIEGCDYFSFCKDAKLFDSNLILRDIPIIFSSFLGESHKLFFDEFYNSVNRIAEKKMIDIESLIELINSNLVSNNINVNHFNDYHRFNDDDQIIADGNDIDDYNYDDTNNDTLLDEEDNNFIDKIEISLNNDENEPYISRMHDSFNKILEESNNTLAEARHNIKNTDINNNDDNKIDQDVVTNIPFQNNNNAENNVIKSLSTLFPTV
jgi:hypothetical protein